jgi:primosomal protein N' (replication factor Y)
VLIDSPLPQLDRLFDYAIPDDLASDAVPGVRVRVPLRSAGRVVDGYLVEVGDPDASDRPLSELDAVVSPVPVLTAGLYALARRAADRAAGSASDILRLAIPRRMVRAEKTWLAAEAPARPEVTEESGAWAREVLSAYPGLAEAVDAGERLAVDAPPSPTQLPDGTPVGSWAVLLAASVATASNFLHIVLQRALNDLFIDPFARYKKLQELLAQRQSAAFIMHYCRARRA